VKLRPAYCNYSKAGIRGEGGDAVGQRELWTRQVLCEMKIQTPLVDSNNAEFNRLFQVGGRQCL